MSWTRYGRGTATRYVHASGWVVRHCGHGTANWPYYLIPPEGHPCDGIVVSHNGLGFRTAEAARGVVVEIVSGNLKPTRNNCAPGIARVLRDASGAPCGKLVASL